MKFKPRHCQQLMMGHMLNTSRCNIWGDPGIGKTSATLAALDILWLVGSNFHPALVIAPLRVARDVWAQEAQKWDELHHLKVVKILGAAKERKQALKQKGDVYVINYENIQWLVDTLKERWFFKIIVADESTRLKNFRLRHGGKRAAALARIAKATGRWINLTGTPAANGLIDLWGQNWFVDRGQRLGRTFTAFKNRWFDEDIYAHSLTPLKHAHDEIPAALSDITMSLSANDFFDLPDIIHNTIPVELPAQARSHYNRMERELYVEMGDETVTAANAPVRSTKCLQIASGAVYNDEGDRAWSQVHNTKLEALDSLVSELSGEPLLCAYHFRFDLERILERFPGMAREIKTSEDVAAWNARKITLGLIHPASAGHGLNLAEGGHQLAFFGLWWNLEQYLQVIERIGPTRQAQLGRKTPVMVHSIVARDTLDELVIERRKGKQAVQDLLRNRLNARYG
jgi:hypothetical protein